VGFGIRQSGWQKSPAITVMCSQTAKLRLGIKPRQRSFEILEAKFIVLSTYSGDVQILRALKAGAKAYLLKGFLRKELLDTIRKAYAGRKRIPPEIPTNWWRAS
jgi:DNA-binding NarL/FixJ family response regulator